MFHFYKNLSEARKEDERKLNHKRIQPCLGPCPLVGEEREWGGDHHCSLWCLATGEIPRLSQAFTGSTTILGRELDFGNIGISHSSDVAPRTVDQAGLPPRPVHSPLQRVGHGTSRHTLTGDGLLGPFLEMKSR